ncbi:hypothetical protein AMTRI_Chr05g64090 [Amborella trichopoda]
MASVMMASEGQPVFHDFLGMSCSSDSAVLAKNGGFSGELCNPSSSDLASERHPASNYKEVQLHGSRSDFTGPEIDNQCSGRKRSGSDSAHMGSMRDRVLQVGTDALENSHLMKIFRNEAQDDRRVSQIDNEFLYSKQPPRPTSTGPALVQTQMSNQSNLVNYNWDRYAQLHPPQFACLPSRFNQYRGYPDKICSNYRDTNAGPSLISPPAADEGSRTGKIGSGISNIISASPGDRNSGNVLLGCNRLKAGTQGINPESAGPSSQQVPASASRQMTIFYAGQAHVFDDVHPKKADAIMSLAGSSGRSWSTALSSKSDLQASPSKENVFHGGNVIGDIQRRPNTSHGGGNTLNDDKQAVQAMDPKCESQKEVQKM